MKQEFVDLGLPSGILWAKHNVKIANKKHFTHYEIPLIEYITGYNVPAEEDFEELINLCKWEWKTIGRTKGCKVTGPNGNYIFLHAADFDNGISLYDAEPLGYYWSTTHNSGYSACYLRFHSSGKYMYNLGKYYGLSIRLIKR